MYFFVVILYYKSGIVSIYFQVQKTSKQIFMTLYLGGENVRSISCFMNCRSNKNQTEN